MNPVGEALVVDASVAAKWVVQEPDSAAAWALIEAGHELLSPALMHIEVANAIGKRARAGELTNAMAIAAFDDLLVVPVRRFEVDDDLAAESLQLALELRHPVQDCLCLALALRHGIRAITADRRFAAACGALPMRRKQIVMLGEPLA